MTSHQDIDTHIITESTFSGVDKKFLNKLLETNNINNIEIITTNGSIHDVFKYLNSVPKLRWYTDQSIKNLLIIVDTDENFKNRLQEIKKITDRLENITVKIFLFPDNKNPGSLETLLWDLLPEDSSLKKDCVNQYFQCLNDKSIDNTMTENNKSKSKFRVFMASPYPDRYVDSILDKIDFTSDKLKSLIKFIKQS
ncbi:hypothetical protein HOC37_06200 [bacterium]|jgi:hypothetical protein|nr:hypothetical protein [bacterium]MBT3581407.1 hypothetical protein [bacterium]MBT4552553.1 hypothetical protein [bacterium]MBT5989018.1 hypothetical protein [bacterium]MBT7087368.1 hypothetical protein [bacterium]